MTGKHYNWHKKWSVDLAACTATHDSGLIVKFTQATDDPMAWDGEPINDVEWLASMRGKMPPHDLVKHTARLLREAGDAYMWQLKKRR